MIKLDLTEEQRMELLNEAVSNPKERTRKHALIICFRDLGLPNQDIAKLLQVDEDTVTNQVKKYARDGVAGVLQNRFKKKLVSSSHGQSN